MRIIWDYNNKILTTLDVYFEEVLLIWHFAKNDAPLHNSSDMFVIK